LPVPRRISSDQIVWQVIFSVVLGIGLGVVASSVSRHGLSGTLSSVAAIAPWQISDGKVAGISVFPMLSQRMTVLVMGVDSNGLGTERFTGTRSDTMLLACLDPFTHKVAVVSIPRDSRVEIAGHGTEKINAAHAFGGPELAVRTLAQDFSIPIDHYVVVDTQALKNLCQLLGPLPVLVEKDMHYNDWSAHLHVDLKSGLQVLSPEQVEQYVRFRHDARGDIGRIERQQWFLRQASAKLKEPQFLLRLPELVRMAHEYIRTDLSVEDMARLTTFARSIKSEDVITATLPGEPQMIGGGSYWIPDMEASRVVFNRALGLAGNSIFVPSTASPSSAVAATPPAESSSPTGPLTVALLYPRGNESTAKQVAETLEGAGYRVRYKWQVSASDCQHDEIMQTSARADDTATSELRKQLRSYCIWPVVLAVEGRPSVDFKIVISPQLSPPATGSGTVSGASTGTATTSSRPHATAAGAVSTVR
jgi:LCP family protein required for cell wall assembly